MSRAIAFYEVEDQDTGEIISRHRTRQAAVDTWRMKAAGKRIRIYRATARDRMLVVEGTWHEGHRTE